ncbi:MAG: hypothetical protein GY923_12120, partial [Aestuariibacter sp.]|nr:hypothetical protein [Aestuariibacter sp.]
MRFSFIVIAGIALVGIFLSVLPTPEVSPVPTDNDARLASWPASGRYQIVNVTVFDGQQWHEHASLSIEDGRIAEPFDTTKASDIEQIDGQGAYIIPGLIDAHTHSWGYALKQSLEYGVTTTLDMFTDLRFFTPKSAERNALSRRQEADLFSSGVLVTSAGGHGTEYGIEIPTIASADDADAFVAARLAEGS